MMKRKTFDATACPAKPVSSGRLRSHRTSCGWAWSASLLTLALFLTTFGVAQAKETAKVFDGPASAYEKPFSDTAAATEPGLLRTISVEERAGVERHGDLARAPLFFAEKECPTLDGLALVAADAPGEQIPWQADDIRHGADGGIARVHLWFEVNLKAGEKKTYRLIRREGAAAKTVSPVAVNHVSGELQVKTANGTYAWSEAGALRSIDASDNRWDFGNEGLFPEVAVDVAATAGNPAAHVTFDRKTEDRQIDWAGGPLFTKIRIRLKGPSGVDLEQDFRLPRNGREIVLTTTLTVGLSGGAVKRNRLLVGTPEGDRVMLQKIPAGIRYTLRAEHAYTVSALTATKGPGALLAVPLVIGGTNGQWDLGSNHELVLEGQSGLQRGGEGEKLTLYAYWSEVRLVPVASSAPESYWLAFRDHVQPLVGIVEEPGASVEQLHTALSALAGEMKPIGWRQDAGRALMWGQTARLGKILSGVSTAKEGSVENLVAGARNATARITNKGARKLREDEKGRAYGGLDPYHVTYTQSAAAAVAVLTDAPASVTTVDEAMARGVREVGGKIDRDGFPYVDCFNRTLNMQLGPVLFGLTAGAKSGDQDLVRFYRDLATAPAVQGVFGRGQRPYTGAPTTVADQTDYLYQSICDFWLRTTELLANDDLHLHPLAYGRYTDCIDVMADRYHGVAARDKAGATGEARANFFRGQAHTHRWLGWSCSPYIRLLEDPAEHGSIGLTEAIRYTQLMQGRWKNWPDLTFYILADVLLRDGLSRYRPPASLVTPDVHVQPTSAGADLSWTAIPNAAEYRIYRTEVPGGPYVWVNSPYVASHVPKVTSPAFHDPAAKKTSTYVVLAVDAADHESPWPDSPPGR